MDIAKISPQTRYTKSRLWSSKYHGVLQDWDGVGAFVFGSKGWHEGQFIILAQVVNIYNIPAIGHILGTKDGKKYVIASVVSTSAGDPIQHSYLHIANNKEYFKSLHPL